MRELERLFLTLLRRERGQYPRDTRIRRHRMHRQADDERATAPCGRADQRVPCPLAREAVAAPIWRRAAGTRGLGPASSPSHGLAFLLQSALHPVRTGAPVATGDSSARTFVDGGDVAGARRVVELGAGTGAVTEALRSRLPAEAQLLAVELNPTLARALQRRFADTNVEVVCASAFELAGLLAERGIGPVERIVCSLPTLSMTESDQQRLLANIRDALAPHGRLSVLLAAHGGLIPAGRRFRRLLSGYFGNRHSSRVLWANVPPLRAYHCPGQ